MAYLWWDWTVFWAYTFGPWGVLWLLGDREKMRESVPAGILFALIAFVLDVLGTQLGYWTYPIKGVPFLSGNMIWNVVAAAPEAMLIVQKHLENPRQSWWWIIGISLANAAAEVFALVTTDLMEYPRWSPLLSIPVYIGCFWLIIHFTRYLWRVDESSDRTSS